MHKKGSESFENQPNGSLKIAKLTFTVTRNVRHICKTKQVYNSDQRWLVTLQTLSLG